MYEDDPQDTVFDVLGEAVFGGHPLGRPIIGRAPVIRDTPVDAISAFHARRYVPRSVVDRGRRLGRPRPDRRAGRADARRRARAGERAPVPDPAPAELRSTVRFHRKDTEQVPRLPRRHRPAARRRAPLRDARARRDLRRPVVLAAVPGRARGARAGLLRLLVQRPVLRHGPDRPLPRHAARTTCARRCRSSRDELARLRESPASEDELARARENVKARVVLGMESTGARMNRLGASLLYDLPLLETDEIMERIDAVTLDDLRALTDELWAPERLSAAGHRPRRGRVPRGRGGGDPRPPRRWPA